VPAERLKTLLGVRQIDFVVDKPAPLINDTRLDA
jgi:hypothetical protein